MISDAEFRESKEDDYRNDGRGMSDEAVSDERDAISATLKAVAALRSELQDAQAKMTTTANRDRIQELLDAIHDAAPSEAHMVESLEEERRG